MVEIVPFDPHAHRDRFRQMNIGLMRWHSEQLAEGYQIDVASIVGQPIEEYVDAHLEPYLLLKPTEGVVYILEVDGEVAGMAALTRLSDDTGELNRVWVDADHRGRGYGRALVDKALEAGRDLGRSTFKLSTAKHARVAQRLYRSVGFEEIAQYPESEVHPILRQYWMYMERKE